MKKRLLALMTALLLLTGCTAQQNPEAEKTSGVGFYFDTVVTLTLYGAPEGLMEELWQECKRYERLLSKTISGSDVDRINHSGGKSVTVDEETWMILSRAKEISEKTGGAFSVTIAPLSAQWDFTGDTHRMPTQEQRLAALPLVDDTKLVLGENNTVTLPEGMSIDLGGIAKGYIADKLADMVRGKVVGATLNFGGNVYIVGEKPDGTAFNIGIANPAKPDSPIAAVTVENTSVVTSGTYQRYFTVDGVTYHHILDPKTGLPADSGMVSASIVSESSMTADALATACVVMGLKDALDLMAQTGYEALFVLADGSIVTTPDLGVKHSLRIAEEQE